MANKYSKILLSQYVYGTGGDLRLIALSKKDMNKHHCRKFLVQWNGEVYRDEYLDSGYSVHTFNTYEEALAYFKANRF